jgi:hypothetical protein
VSAEQSPLPPYYGVRNHPRSKWISSESIDRNTPGDKYFFNSSGYRCAEYNPAAKFTLYVAGCSYTFGTGLSDDERWSVLLASMIAKELGISPEEVNLQNFAQTGASNSYITRTLLGACAARPPNLAIVQFTHANRAEYLGEDFIENIGAAWSLRAEDIAGREWTPGLAYFGSYSDKLGNMDVMKQMLLVHFFLKNRGIPYLACWVQKGIMNEQDNTTDPDLAPLIHAAGQVSLVDYSPRSPELWVDKSARHPGAVSNRLFAQRLFSDCLPLLQIARHAIDGSKRMGATAKRNKDAARRSRVNIWGSHSDGLRKPREVKFAGEVSINVVKSLDRTVRSLLSAPNDESCSHIILSPNILNFEYPTEIGVIEVDGCPSASLPSQLRERIERRRSCETIRQAKFRLAMNLLILQEWANFRCTDVLIYGGLLPLTDQLETETRNLICSFRPAIATDEYALIGADLSLIAMARDCVDHRSALPRPSGSTAPKLRLGRLKAIADALKKRFSKDDPNIYPLW